MTRNLTKLQVDAPVTFEGLNDRQSAFVLAYVESGGGPGSAATAAQAAGYAPTSRAAARVRGHELLRNPKVMEALRNELTRRLNAAATLGVNVLMELAADKNTPAATRLSAAKDLIDRGYGPVASRWKVDHTVRSIEDIIADLDTFDDGSERYIDAEYWPSD
jgi:phage terminase small subunit